MNILFFTKDSTYVHRKVGGAETSIRLIAEHLAARGHLVYYLTMGEEKLKKTKYSVLNGVNVIMYPRRCGNQYKYIFLKAVLGKPYARKTVRDEYITSLIHDLTETKKIDLAYAYYDLERLELLTQATADTATAVVMRMAGLHWYELSKSDQDAKRRYENQFSNVDSINYLTPSFKEIVHSLAGKIDLEYAPKHEFTADIGASGLLFEDQEELATKPSEGKLKIIVATRFSTYQKRQDLIVKAVAELRNKDAIEVLMIGDGPERDKISSMVDEYGLSEIIRITPFMSQSELWKTMRNADILCHPCEYEGLSKIIAEAMLIGLPVMASKVEPLSDYVDHETTGLLVENNPISWAKCIDELVEDFSIAKESAFRAKEYATEFFSPEKNIEAIEAHFMNIIENSDRTGPNQDEQP